MDTDTQPATEYKHHLRIREAGLIEDGNITIDIYSQGGSLFGLQTLIDAQSTTEQLGVTTTYKNNLGTGRIEVTFPQASAADAAAKLDAMIATHADHVVSGSFAGALANAVPPVEIKTVRAL